MTSPVEITQKRAAVLKGYESERCPECNFLQLVRSGNVIVCDNCRWTNDPEGLKKLQEENQPGSVRWSDMQAIAESLRKQGQKILSGHPEYLKLLDEMKELHIKKATDYGSNEDPLQNMRSSAEIGIEPWLGAWLRAKDKVKRIDQFCRTGKLANEGVIDSFMDLAAYCMIAIVLMREKDATPTEAQ